MSDKPSYLKLLNAVSLAESAAHEYLDAWAAVTPNEGVRRVLLAVSAREGEHGKAFAKRINELGFQLRAKDDPGREERLAFVSSGASDLEKMEKLGLGRLDTGDKPDVFDGFFKDHSIDIQTGELLGRYICEERDSGRLLRSCYQELKVGGGGVSDDRLASIEARLDAVCEVVTSLSAAMTPAPSNGKARAGKGRTKIKT